MKIKHLHTAIYKTVKTFNIRPINKKILRISQPYLSPERRSYIERLYPSPEVCNLSDKQYATVSRILSGIPAGNQTWIVEPTRYPPHTDLARLYLTLPCAHVHHVTSDEVTWPYHDRSDGYEIWTASSLGPLSSGLHASEVSRRWSYWSCDGIHTHFSGLGPRTTVGLTKLNSSRPTVARLLGWRVNLIIHRLWGMRWPSTKER